jgi:hypothetical protein
MAVHFKQVDNTGRNATLGGLTMLKTFVTTPAVVRSIKVTEDGVRVLNRPTATPTSADLTEGKTCDPRSRLENM